MSVRGTIVDIGKRKMYMVSPLRRLYPEAGLTVQKLQEISHNDKKSAILIIYRNLIRNVRYLQIHTYFKKCLKLLFKVRIRQDYSYRRNLILRENFPPLTDNELYERLVNTLDFVHNATLDDPETNHTARPISMEYKILNAILQYEISKGLPSGIKNKLKAPFFTLHDHEIYRNSERAFNMSDNNDSSNMWWLDSKTGLFRNEVCFDYIDELQNKEFSTFVEKMVYANLSFEKVIVTMNEDAKLLL